MSLLKDSSLLQASALVRAGLGVVSAFALTHALGATRQGQYYVAVALFSFLYLGLNTGVHLVTVSHLARAAREQDRAEQRAWLAFCLVVQGGVALLLGTLGFLLPVVGPLVAGVEPEVGWWGALLCWTPALELGRSWATAQLQARRHMAGLARLEVATESCRAGLVVGGAVWTASPLGAVLGWVVASAVSLPLAALVLARERDPLDLPRLGEVLRHLGDAPLGRGLREGLPLGVMRSGGMLVIEVLPALAVARFGSPAGVAYLRLAQRMASGVLMLASGVSRTALPALGAQVGDKVAFARLWRRTSLLAGSAVTLAWAVALLAMPWVLSMLAPPDFVAPVRELALALTPGVLAMGFGSSSSSFYVATGNVAAATRIMLVGIPLGALAIVLGASWSAPLGAALGLSLAQQGELAHMAYILRWLRRR